MPIIYSGNANDQAYSSAYKRLVRQSNRARDSFPNGVNPTVAGWIDGMHREGILGKLGGGGLWLPDMYAADAENRVSQMGGLAALGPLSQSTGASQPNLTREDDGMNLVLQSVFPGSLGAGAPSGWTDISGSEQNVRIVESDDGSGGHQAVEVEKSGPTVDIGEISQEVSMLTGQEIIVACYVESAPDALRAVYPRTGDLPAGMTIVSSSDESSVAGRWHWRAINITSSGAKPIMLGFVPGSATGILRFSRACVLHRPPNWEELSDAEKQTYLNNRYAATTTFRQHSGAPAGVSAVHLLTSHSLIGPTINLTNYSAFSFFIYMNCHRDGVTEGYARLGSGNGTRFIGITSGDVRARVLMSGSSDFNLDVTPSGGRSNQWILYGISATVGGQFLYSHNGDIVGSSSLPATAFSNSPWALELNSGSANYTAGAVVLSLGNAFTPDQHAALYGVLTGA